MGNRAADQRHPEEALTRLLNTFRDRGRDFLGLAVADTDHPVAITDDDQSGEAESPTTLDHLRNTVDGDDPFQVVTLVAVAVATTAAATIPTASALACVTAFAACVTALAARSGPGRLAGCSSRLLRHYAVLPISIEKSFEKSKSMLAI